MIIFIHGYNFNLVKGDDPEDQYKYWREFSPDINIIPFKWQSTPARGVWGAWKDGSWNTYHWAWRRATEVARIVAYIIREHESVDIVCHSLGSRVAYEAMKMEPLRVRKVLTMDGADSAVHAKECILAAYEAGGKPEVYCILSREDDILQYLGQVFTPKIGLEGVVGYHGLGEKPHPPGWHEIDITEEADGVGWGDHSEVFTNEVFWPRWRAILG